MICGPSEVAGSHGPICYPDGIPLAPEVDDRICVAADVGSPAPCDPAESSPEPAPILAPRRRPLPKAPSPTPTPTPMDLSELPELQIRVVRWLRGGAALLAQTANDAIVGADTMLESAFIAFATDGLPTPDAIHYADRRVHIPFHGVGQSLPLSSLPWDVARTLAPRTFWGAIHFGEVSFGMTVDPDHSFTLYDIDGVTLEPFLPHRRVEQTVMVNGVPTAVVYQGSECPHRLKTLRIKPKSPLEICVQATVEPPFAEALPQPAPHCFRPFDPYLEAARRAVAERIRRSIHGAASVLQVAVLPVVWVARALMAK